MPVPPASVTSCAVAPIVPAFYNKPKSVDDIINHTVGRMLDFFDIETKLVKRCATRPFQEQLLQPTSHSMLVLLPVSLPLTRSTRRRVRPTGRKPLTR